MPTSSKVFLDIQATIWCGFTLKCVRDMIRRYSQMQRKDKYSQRNSVIWPIWLNGCVFVNVLSGCGFESRCGKSGEKLRKIRYKTFWSCPILINFSTLCQRFCPWLSVATDFCPWLSVATNFC